MKKRMAILLLALCLSACGKPVDKKPGPAPTVPVEENKDHGATGEDGKATLDMVTQVSEDKILEIEKALLAHFGEKDAETGYPFIFEIVGQFNKGGEVYYLGRWRWFVVDHSSLLCEFVLNDTLDGMYECQILDSEILWDEDYNLVN